MTKAIFFDFDGVIVESTDIKTAAFAELFVQEGVEFVKRVVEYHRNNAGVSRFDKFRYIYREILKRSLSEHEFRALCDRFSDLVMNQVIRTPFVNGAELFLNHFHAKYKFFIITATPQEEIDEILRRRDINHLFVGVIGAPTTKTDAVRQVLDREYLLPRETVYIGDAMSDYEAARANTVPFIARIHYNAFIFDSIDCAKVPDLDGLDSVLVKEALQR